jgi:hypothetical protein
MVEGWKKMLVWAGHFERGGVLTNRERRDGSFRRTFCDYIDSMMLRVTN